MERIFLGWDTHFLNLVTNYLIKSYVKGDILDLRNIKIVVTGSKAHKRLLEILLIECDKQNLKFIPPKTFTPQSFFSYVVNLNANLNDSKKTATELDSKLFFVKALKNNSEIVKNLLLKGTSFENDTSSFILLAEKIYTLYKDISASNLQFEDIPKKAIILDYFEDDKRWDALSIIYKDYQKQLKDNNFIDVFIKRREFLNDTKDNSVNLDGDTLFLNIPDLNNVFCDILNKISSKVCHLIFAPKDEDSFFDDFGNVKVNKWLNETIDINDNKIIIANNPRELGKIISDIILKNSKNYSPNDIVIGATQDLLIPSIKLECSENNIDVVSVRDNGISNTNVYTVIELLRTYVAFPLYSNFVNLIYHEDILNYLLSLNKELTKENILVALDSYKTDHLPYLFKDVKDKFSHPKNDSNKLDEKLLTTNEDIVFYIYNKINELILDCQKRQSVDKWCDDILKVFLKLYENKKIRKNNEEDNVLLTTYNAYKDALILLKEVKTYFDYEISFSDALMLLNLIVKNTIFGIPLTGKEIEIQGWLEIQNDDSDFLILAGLKEGSWPKSVNQDEFLPNSLRKILGLMDNDLRYARDFFMTKSILHSKKEVFFVPVRYELLSEGSNLLSKILLATTPQNQAKRLLSFYDIKDIETQNIEIKEVNNDNDINFFLEPKIQSFDLPKISVTALNLYKRSPYEFYLNFVLNLKNQETNVTELDNLMIGNLLHDVLNTFAKSKIKESCDDTEIYNFLITTLNNYIYNNLESSYLPTIDIQLESIKVILKNFSRWQADFSHSGWKIIHSEIDCEDFYITCDGEKTKITGRIDRIDYNKNSDEWLIIDYKTSKLAMDINRIFRPRLMTWTDYQMPLYVEYFKQTKKLEKVSFAYLNLFQKKSEKYLNYVEPLEGSLDIALEEVQELIRNIKSANFWPPSKNTLKALEAFNLS